jgi:hypothetical protein
MTRTGMRIALARAWEERPELFAGLLTCAVALAASATSLANGFAYDDIPIIVRHPMVQQLGWPWEYFLESYWGPDRGNTLYRPVTVLLYALERWAGDGSPFSFHVMNVALYLATCLAVLLLARELLPRGPALVASLLFAAHPVHVEAVGNVVGQSEMLAAIPLLLAVVLYIRDRTRGALRARTVTTIALLFVLALLCKEHGILLPGLLALTELAFRGRRFAAGPDADRSLVALAKLFGALIVVYFAARYAVLGAMLGDTPHPSLERLSHAERVLAMVGLLPEVLRLLTWPVRLYADYSPNAVPMLTSPSAGHLPGLAIVLAYLAGLAFAWRRRSGVALFALLWLPATWVLVSNLVFPSGVLIAERTLLLPSLSMVMLVGLGCAAAVPMLERSTPVVRGAVVAGFAGLVLIATIHSAERQRAWMDNPTVFSTLVVDAPANFKAQHAFGEMLASVGIWDQAERHMLTADSIFPRYDLVELGIARVRHFSDRCPEAVPYYDSVLVRRPDAELALIGRAACYLEMRQLSRARDEAVTGITRGNAVETFRTILQKAESSLVATDTVDTRNRWFRAGKPTSKSDARLRVPVLMMPRDLMPQGRKTPEFVPDSGA